MATPAAILDIVVDANTTSATAALSRFDSKLKTTGKTATSAGRYTDTLNKRTGMLGGALSSAARAAGAAAIAYLSISQAKAAVTTTQELSKTTAALHRNLGLSVKRGSQWATVAKSRDIDTRSLNMSFTTLSRRLTDANKGSETAIDTFKDLGVSQADLKKTGGDFNQQLLLIADAFGEAGGGAVRQQAAQKLLGRGYQTLLPMFAEGSKGLKEQFGWAAKYGAELDTNTVDQQMKLTMMLRESKVAALGLQIAFTEAITPALKKANHEFQKISHILSDDKLTNAEKFKKVGGIIEEWASKAFDAFLVILPKLAEKAAEAAPKIVAALVKGFMNAGAWGALAGGVWLASKIGVTAGVGKRFGTKFGGALVAGVVAAVAVWQTSGGLKDTFEGVKAAETVGEEIGTALGSGVGPKLQKAIDQHSLPALERLRSKMEKVGAWMKEAGIEGSEAFTNLQNKIASSEDKIRASVSKIRDSIHRMEVGFHSDLSSITKDTEKNFQQIKATMGTKSQQARDLINKNFDSAVIAIRNAMTKGGKLTDKGMQAIADVARQRLSAFGITGADAEKIIKAQGAKRGDLSGFQRGGAIFGGNASGDSVPALLERGEYVLNRNAVKTVGKNRLDGLNFGAASRFAEGGIVPAPGFPGEQINSKVVGAFTSLVKRFNLFLTDAYGPGHASTEHTKYGTAIDVIPGPGGSWSDVGRAVAASVKAGYNPVYYDGSFGSINLPPHGPGHHAHITLLTAAELLSGKTAGGAGALNLKLPRFVGKFIEGKGGAAGLNNASAALEKILGERAAQFAAPETGEGLLGSVEIGPIQQMARQMVEQIWGSGQWAAFNELEMREAGWNPRALNASSGAAGLAQALPASKYPPGAWPYKGLDSARLQLQWMMGYIKDRYGSPSAALSWHDSHNWYKKGGIVDQPFVGSFKDGGKVGKDGIAKVHKGETITKADKKEWDKLIHQQLVELKKLAEADHRLKKQARGVLREQGASWAMDALGGYIADVGVRSSRYAGNGRLTAIGGKRG